jgi:hypothetical protein
VLPAPEAVVVSPPPPLGTLLKLPCRLMLDCADPSSRYSDAWRGHWAQNGQKSHLISWAQVSAAAVAERMAKLPSRLSLAFPDTLSAMTRECTA